jgi:hypothetical protein
VEGRRLCDTIADGEAWRCANVRAVPAEVGEHARQSSK